MAVLDNGRKEIVHRPFFFLAQGLLDCWIAGIGVVAGIARLVMEGIR